MKAMSKFLESSVGSIRVRSILTLILCAVNFVLAYGICVYYLKQGSPSIMNVSLAITVVLVLVLAFPNLEVQDDAKATDLVD